MAQGMTLTETGCYKSLRSSGYNYHFNKANGLFVRWGENVADDPQQSPYGPEIADIEISTGDCSSMCPWCYKSNDNSRGKHMTLSTFEAVLQSLPPTVTQVALGITDANANSDFVAILEACQKRGIVPNYTTAGFGLTPEIEKATARLCGAVAVSVYPHNRKEAWDTVRRFIALGMEQVNVHLLYYGANVAFVESVLQEAESIDGLNAVVLLGLKPKGGADGWQPLGQQEFSEIVDSAKVRIGFDSCSAPKFENWAESAGREDLLMFSERCESSLFSIYIDVDGRAWPCSFAEGHPSLEAVDAENAWNSPQFEAFRSMLLENNRECPLYNV